MDQVSLAGLPALLSGPGTNPLNSTSNGAGPGSADSIALSEEEIQTTRCRFHPSVQCCWPNRILIIASQYQVLAALRSLAP